MKNFLRWAFFCLLNLVPAKKTAQPYYLPEFCKLTLADLRNADDTYDFWAINNSVFTDQPGELHLSLSPECPEHRTGRYPSLYIPQTWLPHPVTLQIRVQSLVRSPELRSALDKGLLTLVPALVAGQIHRLPAADHEKQRLAAHKEAVRAACAANR